MVGPLTPSLVRFPGIGEHVRIVPLPRTHRSLDELDDGSAMPQALIEELHAEPWLVLRDEDLVDLLTEPGLTHLD